MRNYTMAMLGALVGLAGCVSMTPAGEAVRITTRSDVVASCTFITNVKATSGWGGAAGQGLADSNTEKTLQNKTAKAGGNVVYINNAGQHASGEAYRCPDE
ncbi:MAG: DUF4156 domain-containing protein [Pseudomonadota bacterium]|nr:DUF4156 domain-containing protein [Pseudomonadota bacterium]